MDIVTINSLKAQATIGVHDWERCIRQSLLVDLDLYCDIQAAAKTDDLTLAIDYSAVADTVTELIESSEFRLIETLAETIARKILADFNIKKLRLSLNKPGAVKNAKTVGIIIEREQ